MLELNVDEIKDKIGKNSGIYDEDGVVIKRNGDKYTVQINKALKFIGDFNSDFKFTSNGLINYSNGDVYLGSFSEGRKQGNGLYCYSTGDIYIGKWKDNKKNDFGIYIWKDSQNPKIAFIGEMMDDRMIQGLSISLGQSTISKDIISHYVYSGEYLFNGVKSHKKCFFHNFEQKYSFNGDIFEDSVRSGHVLQDDRSLMAIQYSIVDGASEEITELEENITKENYDKLQQSFESFNCTIKENDFFKIVEDIKATIVGSIKNIEYSFDYLNKLTVFKEIIDKMISDTSKLWIVKSK